MNLSEVRAVVTGAAGGLGRVFCRKLLENGSKVIATDFSGPQLAKLEEELKAVNKTGKNFTTFQGDVSSEGDIENLFAKAREIFGGCNVLINNAGIMRDATLVKRDKSTGQVNKNLSRKDWEDVMNINLKYIISDTGPVSLYASLRNAGEVAGGKEAKSVVVNISSLSRIGNFGQSNYSSAKAGLATSTVAWAKELAPLGIRVGAIAPGVVKTPIIEHLNEKAVQALLDKIALKRFGNPEDIWMGVRFIIECDFFTGRTLEIDGGQTSF